MPPLVIRSLPGVPASFLPIGAVGLPVMVESAGWILPFRKGFRLWINRSGENKMMQFNVTPSQEIGELDSLPLVGAGTVGCERGFIVTGADASGLPLVAATDADGRLSWQHVIEGPAPFRWPIPGCGRKPVILWQTDQGRVEIAEVSAKGVGRRTSFAVGGPPLDLAAAGDSVWAVWADASGVVALEATANEVKKFHLSQSYTSEIAVGVCVDGVCVAWGQPGYTFLARKHAGREAFEEPLKLDVGAAVGGTLRVIPGDEPLVHAARAWLKEGEPARVLSVLTGPGYRPLAIEGIVHSVASHGNTVVLLGETELRFLGRVPCD
jgi:hypothetical protein